MRTIIILILIYIAYRVLKRIFYFERVEHRHVPEDTRPKNTPAGEETFIDPVCKAYVPASNALTEDIDGVTRHFCSYECRDKFRASIRKD